MAARENTGAQGRAGKNPRSATQYNHKQQFPSPFLPPASASLYEKHYIPSQFPRIGQDWLPQDDMIAYGGDLSVDMLIEAYSKGIFPWYNQPPIRWYCPLKRLLLLPNSFHQQRSFKKFLRTTAKKMRISFDTAFEKVVESCAFTVRKNQEGTWINRDMRKAYLKMHLKGLCHSVEVWAPFEKVDSRESQDAFYPAIDREKIAGKQNQAMQLVGGLYGVSLGRAFFGESMFSHRSNASKIALHALSTILFAQGYYFIDCQISSPHLIGLGAKEVSREFFNNLLEQSNAFPTQCCNWNYMSAKYDLVAPLSKHTSDA